MSQSREISRRQFVASATAVAAISSFPAADIFGDGATKNPHQTGSAQTMVPLIESPNWKDQAVENLTKSPYAKLRNIPVHAVTIQKGFWSPRREVNVAKSIPTMHDLLEAHGRMDNFRRLVGKSSAPQRGPVFSD